MKLKFLKTSDDFLEKHFSKHLDKMKIYGERSAYLAIVIIITVLLFLILIPMNIFAHTENTILDALIKQRAINPPTAELLRAASEDIVFLAMDTRTLAYGRNNPEINISGERVLPRRYVAKIIDYLREEGAKAIVFDVEFKGSQDPENDIPLAEAMKKVPKEQLFLALRTDSLLSKHLNSFNDKHPKHNRFLIENLIYPQLIYPDEQINQVLKKLTPPSFGINLAPPLFISNAFTNKTSFPPPRPQLSLFNRTSLAPYPKLLQDTAVPHMYQPLTDEANQFKKRRKEKKVIGGTDLHALITTKLYQNKVCFKDSYQNQYKNEPKYLELLESTKLDISFPVNIDPWFESTYSYCFVESIEKTLQNSGFSIGITSVEYDDDQFDRKTPLLYKIYNRSPQTYLGVKVALNVLKPDKTFLTPKYFQINDRKIPITKQAATVINWRSADKLTENLLLRGNLENYYRAHLLFPYARLNASLPPEFKLSLLPYAHHAMLPKSNESLYQAERLLNYWSQINTFWQNSGQTTRNAYVTARRVDTGTYRAIYDSPAFQSLDLKQLLNQNSKQQDTKTGDQLSGHLYRKISISEVLKKIGLKGQNAIEKDRQFLKTRKFENKIYRLEEEPFSGEFSFKDKIVIYGDSLGDIHRTPMGIIFGPEVVATVTDMIIHDQTFIQFTPMPLVIVIGLLFSLLAAYFPLTFEDVPIALGGG